MSIAAAGHARRHLAGAARSWKDHGQDARGNPAPGSRPEQNERANRYFFFSKSSEAEFMQKRWPVGFGPSGNR